jgi:DNA polymerase-3 subunit delta
MGKAKAQQPVEFRGEERIVTLYGKEPLLIDDAQRKLRQALARQHEAEIDVIRFDGSQANLTLAEVLDELRSFGLMTEHKLVIVADADKFITDHREALERYAESPAPAATLLLKPSKWNRSWRLHKAIARCGEVVECTASPGSVKQWVKDRAKAEHGCQIAPEAADRLIERIGRNLGRLDGELGKLAAGLGDGKRIEPEDVAALVGRASDEDFAWSAMQDAMVTGDTPTMLAKVSELNDLAGAHEVMLMRAASDFACKLAHAANMTGQGRRDFDICKQLKVFPQWKHEPFIRAARRLGPDRAARLLDAAVDLDARSKSGFGEARRNLERLCVLLGRQVG